MLLEDSLECDYLRELWNFNTAELHTITLH